ncbi:RILP-like protein 1 isoform X2 [Hydra vulgaris]|uniref:RILP-like protein 1 isoform X2 n=1 Tax=Hydra vulgaris TaxID=6087 RepID=UPI001F5E710D|nr:RILP-like protein 1 isoform X2 [Hydra vulgaris]
MEECLTVADVYEYATLIGQDIEDIVNQYGKEIIQEIMPKIVFVLEKLEKLVEEKKYCEERVQNLLIEKEQLTIHSKRDEAILRQQKEKIGYLEELISGDKKILEDRIHRLHEENEFLSVELDKREDELVKIRSDGVLPGDVELMIRMKKTIDSQRDQLRVSASELEARKKELEALQDHTAHLSEINERLRKSNCVLEGILRHDGSDSPSVDNWSQYKLNENESNESVNETSLLDELRLDDCSSSDDVSNMDQKLSSYIPVPQENDQNDELLEQSSNLTEQITPIKDPNRPRYTLKEMQVLLEERNLLKIKTMALEEELELLKNSSISLPSNGRVKEVDKKGVRSLMSKFWSK